MTDTDDGTPSAIILYNNWTQQHTTDLDVNQFNAYHHHFGKGEVNAYAWAMCLQIMLKWTLRIIINGLYVLQIMLNGLLCLTNRLVDGVVCPLFFLELLVEIQIASLAISQRSQSPTRSIGIASDPSHHLKLVSLDLHLTSLSCSNSHFLLGLIWRFLL